MKVVSKTLPTIAPVWTSKGSFVRWSLYQPTPETVVIVGEIANKTRNSVFLKYYCTLNEKTLSVTQAPTDIRRKFEVPIYVYDNAAKLLSGAVPRSLSEIPERHKDPITFSEAFRTDVKIEANVTTFKQAGITHRIISISGVDFTDGCLIVFGKAVPAEGTLSSLEINFVS